MARVLTHVWMIAALVALGGCATRGKASITSGADVVKSGTGTIEYVARHDGTVYVLDDETNRLLTLAGVRKGQTVRIDAATNRITVGEKTVTDVPISDRHRYKIYFRGDPGRNDR